MLRIAVQRGTVVVVSKGINVRLSDDLRDKLQAVADEERRTLSALIRLILEDFVSERDAGNR